jgi:hypothetical protein
MKGKTSYALPKEQKENMGGAPRQVVREPQLMRRVVPPVTAVLAANE